MKNGKADIHPSKGCLENFGNWPIGKSAFFFAGNPGPIVRMINLFGRHSLSRNGVIIVKGKQLPKDLYMRFLDQTIIVPRGYQGPAIWQDPPAHVDNNRLDG